MKRMEALELNQGHETWYQELLEAVPDALVVVNHAGEIVLLNVQAETQFGYGSDEHRCDEVQGYYFGKPMPADLFARMLERGVLEAVAAHDLDRRIEALERDLASRDQIVATLQEELTASRATIEELEQGSRPGRTESTQAQGQSERRRRGHKALQASSPG